MGTTLVWWVKAAQRKAKITLTKAQKLACLYHRNYVHNTICGNGDNAGASAHWFIYEQIIDITSVNLYISIKRDKIVDEWVDQFWSWHVIKF